jgi:hypothetical protein
MIHGPKPIVTNGLVLALDAANSKSFVSGSTTWKDLSGNNYNGTLTNGPAFDTKYGGALVFNGSNNFIALPFTASSPSVQPYTYEIVFNPNTSLTLFKGLMGQSSYLGSGFSIGFNNATNLYIQAYSGSAAYVNQSVTFSNSNTPTMITLTLDGRNIKGYSNSVLQANDTTSFDIEKNTGNIVIAGNVQGGWPNSNVSVYSVKIYNRALSAAEIQQNYNAQKSRFNLI